MENPVVPAAVTEPEPTRMDAASLEFLYKEYSILKDLFVQVEQATQNIFNFYLTLITTVTGAILIILQIADRAAITSVQSQISVGGLLFFAAAIGSVYLSSLNGRYAHMARYAQAMDQIRRFIILHLDIPVPSIYQAFLSDVPGRQGMSFRRWSFWLFPTGTYQLFIAAFNSLSMAMGALLILLAGGGFAANTRGSWLATGTIFVLTFFIYNIYSQFVMRKLLNRLNVQFYTTGNLDWIAGKQ